MQKNDIIKDLGLDLSLDSEFAVIREQIVKNDPNWASFIEGKKTGWVEKMEKIAPVS